MVSSAPSSTTPCNAHVEEHHEKIKCGMGESEYDTTIVCYGFFLLFRVLLAQ
jgi:hypothetical protein